MLEGTSGRARSLRELWGARELALEAGPGGSGREQEEGAAASKRSCGARGRSPAKPQPAVPGRPCRVPAEPPQGELYFIPAWLS